MKKKYANKLLAAVVGLMSASVYAGDLAETVVTTSTASVEANVGYASEYIWRGAHVGDSVTSTDLSTSFELPNDLSLDIGAWYNMTDTDNDEFVGTIAVSKSFSDYLVALSYTWYSVDFDRSSGDAQEVGLTVSRYLGPVSVSLTQYVALESDNNSYSQIAAQYSSNFDTLPFVVDFYGEVGYLVEQGKLTHALAKVSTDIPVVQDVVASPFVAGSVALSDASSANVATKNYVFAGLEFKRNF